MALLGFPMLASILRDSLPISPYQPGQPAWNRGRSSVARKIEVVGRMGLEGTLASSSSADLRIYTNM